MSSISSDRGCSLNQKQCFGKNGKFPLEIETFSLERLQAWSYQIRQFHNLIYPSLPIADPAVFVFRSAVSDFEQIFYWVLVPQKFALKLNLTARKPALNREDNAVGLRALSIIFIKIRSLWTIDRDLSYGTWWLDDQAVLVWHQNSSRWFAR